MLKLQYIFFVSVLCIVNVIRYGSIVIIVILFILYIVIAIY